MRVNEIFYSLQGEGHYAGTPAVFLRFSGCNLSCPFCDTAHEGYEEMDADAIAEAVGRFPARHLVITGGEPSLQVTADLLSRLKREGFYVQMETNGSVPLADDAVALIDWISCSPKGLPVAISRVDELKVLFFEGCDDLSCYEAMAERFGAELRLQPCDYGDAARNAAVVEAAIGYAKANPRWRLSVQLHKLLNIR